MGYSSNEQMVRVDFFKQSGKWHASEAVEMIEWSGNEILIHESLVNGLDRLEKRLGSPYMRGMQVICLEPYHEYSHPICIKNWQGKNAWLKKQQWIKEEVARGM